MKTRCLSLIFAAFIALVPPAFAKQDAKEILKAIVRIRSKIPENARTAEILGTEREGSGVVIDSKDHILTIGYLIVEAETIEVVGHDGKPISATFIGYDHRTGFGLLRAEKPLHVAPMKLGQSSEVKEGDVVMLADNGGSGSVQQEADRQDREYRYQQQCHRRSCPFAIVARVTETGAGWRNLGVGKTLDWLAVR